MPAALYLGRRIRALRSEEGITQAACAARLGISPSYLNLLEHDRRPVSARLLIRFVQAFGLDLAVLEASAGGDDQLAQDLTEVFGDPLFDDSPVKAEEVTELVASSPGVARAILRLHHAFVTARGSVESLAEQVLDDQEVAGFDRARLPSEEVSDLIQRHGNHFPVLEEEAERVWADGKLARDDLFRSLAGYLEREHGVTVVIRTVGQMRGAVRRFDSQTRSLQLSEVLRRGSRNFQLAHQIGLLDCTRILDRMSHDAALTSGESRALFRVALANYFAGAVLMPYLPFLKAAEDERYDLELLGHRFRSSFEQVCHRLTTLRREGASGVPFHMVRVDPAGNISKKFSAGDLRFPRFSGLCPLWNVHAAFLQPGIIRRQLSRMPDGQMVFSVGRTVRKHPGGFRSPQVLYAIALGCDPASAARLVYAEGFDLTSSEAATPVGMTCRLCDRLDCEARAFPSLRSPLRVDESVRGISFFAPVAESEA